VTQQARNLALAGLLDQKRFLIHDRDGTFSHAFDEVFRTEDITVIHTPVRAPKANAYAERFVRTIRNDCLDWLLILGRRDLERTVRAYTDHYNTQRPHRALALLPPNGPTEHPPADLERLHRRDILGGLIHEYHPAAA